jgi:hypothetical protein
MDNQKSVSEQAERLSRRRAKMLPVLAIFLLIQQTTAFTSQHDPLRTVDHVKIAAWLVLSIVMIVVLFTGGFWLRPKAVRAVINDEATRSHQLHAIAFGYLFSMGAAIALYFLSLFEPLSGREAVHVVMTFGIAAALIRWGVLERRADRNG